jgi:hypothetical protein
MLWMLSVAHALTVSLPQKDLTVHLDASGTVTLPITFDLAGGTDATGCTVDSEKVKVVPGQLRCSGRQTGRPEVAKVEDEGPSCRATLTLPTDHLVAGDCALDLVIAVGQQSIRSPVTLRVPA